jgi:predicted secreted protein
MSLLTIGAIFFIIWWTVLFVVLPLGHRSQQDEGDVALGTIESAPPRFRFWRVVALTTVLSVAIHGGYYLLSTWTGIGVADIPNILPDFG